MCATFQAYYCRCSCTVLGRHTCVETRFISTIIITYNKKANHLAPTGTATFRGCYTVLQGQRRKGNSFDRYGTLHRLQCSRGSEEKATILIGMGPYTGYSAPGPGRKGNSFDRYGTLHRLQCSRGGEGRVITVWELTVFQVRGRKGNSMGP